MLGREGLAERARLVIEKPFGLDLDSARQLDRSLKEVVEGGAGVPDRPLPRQGGGAEHPGAALRQRALRAGHGTGGSVAEVQIDVPETLGMEGRGSFYESDRLPARHDLHPPVPAARLRGPRGPGHVGRAGAPGCQVRGLPGDAPTRQGAGSSSASTTAIATRTTSTTSPTWRPSSRSRPTVDNDRWRGRAVPSPHRQEAGRGPADHRAGVRTAGLEVCSRPAGDSTSWSSSSPTTPASAVDLRAKRPGPDMELAEATMTVDLVEEISGLRAARGLRAAAARRAARGPDPVHPGRRGRAAVGGRGSRCSTTLPTYTPTRPGPGARSRRWTSPDGGWRLQPRTRQVAHDVRSTATSCPLRSLDGAPDHSLVVT